MTFGFLDERNGRSWSHDRADADFPSLPGEESSAVEVEAVDYGERLTKEFLHGTGIDSPCLSSVSSVSLVYHAPLPWVKPRFKSGLTHMERMFQLLVYVMRIWYKMFRFLAGVLGKEEKAELFIELSEENLENSAEKLGYDFERRFETNPLECQECGEVIEAVDDSTLEEKKDEHRLACHDGFIERP